MTGRLIRRPAQAAPAVLAMTDVVFVGVNVLGDPVEIPSPLGPPAGCRGACHLNER